MKFVLLASLISITTLAETDVFHGWSADDTWYAFETHSNEAIELHLCQTNIQLKPKVKSTWPIEDAGVDDAKCVHFLDPNKAPWQWKSKLKLPAASLKTKGLSVSSELVYGVDDSGFVVEGTKDKQICAASGLREESKIQSAWWNPSGKVMAALIDGKLRHCDITLPVATLTTKKKK
jgi:hypothetical protein